MQPLPRQGNVFLNGRSLSGRTRRVIDELPNDKERIAGAQPIGYVQVVTLPYRSEVMGCLTAGVADGPITS